MYLTTRSIRDPNLDMVTIIVKCKSVDDRTKQCFLTRKFRMNKSFVCYHSKMLDKGFNNPFIEG